MFGSKRFLRTALNRHRYLMLTDGVAVSDKGLVNSAASTSSGSVPLQNKLGPLYNMSSGQRRVAPMSC